MNIEELNHHNDRVNDLMKTIYPKLYASFPDFEFSAFPYVVGAENLGGRICNVTFSLNNNNSGFEASKYFVKTKGRKFVHFTSLQKVLNIIQSKSLRIFTLDSTNDPNEIEFTGNKYKSIFEKRDLQKEIFSFSFSDYSSLMDLNLWRFYGEEGRGAALIFEFENSPTEWNDFHVSQIFYGNCKAKMQLDHFTQKLVEYSNEEIPIFISNLNLLYAFHKPLAYKPEKEKRLIYYAKFNQMADCHNLPSEYGNKNLSQKMLPIVQKTISKFGNICHYLELPLKHNFNNELENYFFRNTPQIKVIGVALGFQMSEAKIVIARNTIQHYADEFLGYSIPNHNIKVPESLKGIFRS